LVLPECSFLTDAQVALIRSFLGRGGRVLAVGGLGDNLSERARAEIFAHPHVFRATSVSAEGLVDGWQVRMGTDVDCAIGLHRLSDREAAVHVVRYDYDEVLDRDLGRRDAAQLFQPSTTRIALRAGSYLRMFVFDFIQMFAPQLVRSTIEAALGSVR
jgi:hypothetical protein